MYYYIFEPPREAKEYERTTQIKEALSHLGIAGEMTTPSPGKTVEDLVALAVAKRYSTVIAVGGTELVNRVARALQPHETVFGIIPFSENEDVARLIGVSNWKEAAEQLKRRRWQPVRMGLINGEICFLTPATIEIPTRVGYELRTPDFRLRGDSGTVTISPARRQEESWLTVDIGAATPRRQGLFSSLLRRQANPLDSSHFSCKSVELHTGEVCQVTVAGADICSTPVRCTTQAGSLKLIVARGSAQPDNS